MKRIWLVTFALAIGLYCVSSPAQWNGCKAGFCNPVVAGGSTFSLSYVSEAENNTSQTSYTLSGVSIGAADPNRYVAIVIGIRSTAAISTPTVTIDPGGGAQAASLVSNSEQISGTGAASYNGVFMVPTSLASGTSATITIGSFGSAAARAAICIYRVVSSHGTATGNHSAAINPSVTTTVTSGGGIVAGAVGSGGVSSTMTNLTQDYSAGIGAGTTIWACGHDTTHTGVSTAYTITWNTVPANPGGTFAYWGP